MKFFSTRLANISEQCRLVYQNNLKASAPEQKETAGLKVEIQPGDGSLSGAILRVLKKDIQSPVVARKKMLDLVQTMLTQTKGSKFNPNKVFVGDKFEISSDKIIVQQKGKTMEVPFRFEKLQVTANSVSKREKLNMDVYQEKINDFGNFVKDSEKKKSFSPQEFFAKADKMNEIAQNLDAVPDDVQDKLLKTQKEGLKFFFEYAEKKAAEQRSDRLAAEEKERVAREQENLRLRAETMAKVEKWDFMIPSKYLGLTDAEKESFVASYRTLDIGKNGQMDLAPSYIFEKKGVEGKNFVVRGKGIDKERFLGLIQRPDVARVIVLDPNETHREVSNDQFFNGIKELKGLPHEEYQGKNIAPVVEQKNPAVNILEKSEPVSVVKSEVAKQPVFKKSVEKSPEKNPVFSDADYQRNAEFIKENDITVRQERVNVNGKVFKINVFEKQGKDNQNFLVVHDSENEAFDTGLHAIKNGGRLVALESGEKRNLEGTNQDPNGIFINGGVFKPVAEKIIQLLGESGPVISLHNNRPGWDLRQLWKQGHKNVKPFVVDPEREGDVIWISGTKPYSEALPVNGEIQKYTSQGINVVYEYVDPIKTNDKSLSNWAAKNGRTYYNVEIRNGDRASQEKYLSAVLSFQREQKEIPIASL